MEACTLSAFWHSCLSALSARFLWILFNQIWFPKTWKLPILQPESLKTTIDWQPGKNMPIDYCWQSDPDDSFQLITDPQISLSKRQRKAHRHWIIPIWYPDESRIYAEKVLTYFPPPFPACAVLIYYMHTLYIYMHTLIYVDTQIYTSMHLYTCIDSLAYNVFIWIGIRVP